MPNSLETLIATVRDHGEELVKQQECIKKIEEKQSRMDRGQDVLFEWKKGMEEWKKDSDANYRDLKDTIMSENRHTQNLFQSMMDKQWKLIESKNEASEAEKSRHHEIVKGKQEIKRDSVAKLWDIVKVALGTSGVLYIIVEMILTK